MATLTAADAHHTLMSDFITPGLRERGFTGAGNFRRRLPKGWHLLTFQGTHSATGTITLAVDVAAITDSAWADRQVWYAEHTPAVKVPDRPTATWVDSERLGILRMGLDNLYEYGASQDMAAMGARILGDIDKYAVPFMEKKVKSA
jgi:hypothetical protein